LFVPGLDFRPRPKDGSTLIWYKGNNLENFKQWTDMLDDFLKGWFSYGFN
jgi:hypothetical protein